jgi:hypothetical protein
MNQDIYVFHTIHHERASQSVKADTYRQIDGERLPIPAFVKTYVANNMANLEHWQPIMDVLDQGDVACVSFQPPPDKKRAPPFLKGEDRNIINADYIPVLEYVMPGVDYRTKRPQPSQAPSKIVESPKEVNKRVREEKIEKKSRIFDSLFGE